MLNLANNRLSSFPAVELPSLIYLNLSGNHIFKPIDFSGMESLEQVYLGHNSLQGTVDISLPQLKVLDISENKI